MWVGWVRLGPGIGGVRRALGGSLGCAARAGRVWAGWGDTGSGCKQGGWAAAEGRQPAPGWVGPGRRWGLCHLAACSNWHLMMSVAGRSALLLVCLHLLPAPATLSPVSPAHPLTHQPPPAAPALTRAPNRAACWLQGGKEATRSNALLHKLIVDAVAEVAPAVGRDLIGLVTSRDEIDQLLKLHDVIDLVIPRGSNQLVGGALGGPGGRM